MVNWGRGLLIFMTIFTSFLILLGAFLPTFGARKAGSLSVGLLKTCEPRNAGRGLDSIDLGAKDVSGRRSLTNVAGYKCVGNDVVDQAANNAVTRGVRELGSSIKSTFKEMRGDTVTHSHTTHPRPTAEKVSLGFLCTAGVFTALIGFFAMFPSLTIYTFSYMFAPLLLHIIGFGLMIWTGMERLKSTVNATDRTVEKGLALEITSMVFLVVLTALWSSGFVRKPVATKYGV